MPASSVAEGKSLEANTQPKRRPSGSRCASLGQRVCRCRGLRVGARLIPKGHSANRSLSAIEPVSATAKRKLENGEQRPVLEIYPARAEIPKIAGQRLGSASVTRGNVAGSHTPGNITPETRLPGWGGRIRTSAWRNQNPLPYRLATPQRRFLSRAAARGGRTIMRGGTSRNRCWRPKIRAPGLVEGARRMVWRRPRGCCAIPGDQPA